MLPKPLHWHASMMPMSVFDFVEFQSLLVVKNLASPGIGLLHNVIALSIQGGNLCIMIAINLIEL